MSRLGRSRVVKVINKYKPTCSSQSTSAKHSKWNQGVVEQGMMRTCLFFICGICILFAFVLGKHLIPASCCYSQLNQLSRFMSPLNCDGLHTHPHTLNGNFTGTGAKININSEMDLSKLVLNYRHTFPGHGLLQDVS